MDKYTSKDMKIGECLKHFNPCESELIYCYVVGQEEGAQWFTCINPCTVDGVELTKRDLILFDRNRGVVCGVFKPIESTSNNKPTNTDATLGA